MKSKSEENQASQEYVYGEDSAITTTLFNKRTADKQAAFFLSYLQPGMSLLYCGSGSGSITVGLAEVVEPGQVTGIDISEAEVERARERAVEASVSNLRFRVGNVYQLEFADNSFDALFSNNVLEHVPETHVALQEMYRVLKPGGIIGLRNMDWGGVLLGPYNEHMERIPTLGEGYMTCAEGHPRLSRSLGTSLHEVGFKDVIMSASYDLYNDLESRKLVARAAIKEMGNPDYIDRVTRSGLAKVEDLEAITDALQTWAETPGAFYAKPECEAIGRKAK